MQKLKYLVLLIPVLFLYTGTTIELAKFGNDPNYVYLVNSLAICNGIGVGYIDHPGTTVMQIGAATIALTHLFWNPENQTLTEHVLSNSHAFILSIRNVFLVLNTLILLLIGWYGFRKTRSVWVAVLLQVSTLVTINTLDHIWTKVSPEPLLFFILGLYVMLVLRFYFDEKRDNWKYVLLFALISGAGLGTKATFLPLIALPTLVLPGLKKKLFYLAGIVPAFVLFTIPIIPEYENMYYWFRDLSSHSGIYGHGKKGFIDLATYLPNILLIIRNNPVFAAVLAPATILSIIVIIRAFRSKAKMEISELILTGLSISSLGGMLMVAKHYHVNHYLIPVLLLSGILLYFTHQVLMLHFKSEMLKKYSIPAVTISILVLVVIKIPPGIKYFNDGYKLTNQEMDSTNAMIESLYSDYTRIYYYPNSLNQFSALNFGDVYCQRRMLDKILSVHGDRYFYHSIEKTLKTWNREIYIEDLVREHGKKIILTGGPRDLDEANDLQKIGLPLTNIYKGRLQAIYLMDTLRYNLNHDSNVQFRGELQQCDVELLSADGKNLLSSSGELFAAAFGRNYEESHSGEYSLKLDENREFAFEHVLQDVKAADKYEISVWRKSSSHKGKLVVAAMNSDVFYKAGDTVTLSDDNGWELIRIKLEIPEILDGEKLKIYTWNPEKNTLWFDDMSIRKIERKAVEDLI